MKFNLLITILFSFLLNGCLFQNSKTDYYQKIASSSTQDNNIEHIYNNLNSAIADISRQLNLTQDINRVDDKVVVTSFVNLENFKKTTKFGHILSESMINELNKYNFKVLDYRGRDNLLVNQNGEFYLTRDASKLKDEIENANILVGTYSNFDLNSIMINVRILDFESGEVLATAKVIYTNKDCKLFGNCVKPVKKVIKPIKQLPILRDDNV